MTASVGIFWLVDGKWIAAGCSLDDAVPYGDALTYDGGHAEHWERWQNAGAHWLGGHDLPLTIMTDEYEDHPRGRVVKMPDHFIIYADRRLLGPKSVARIVALFGLERSAVRTSPDAHYC